MSQQNIRADVLTIDEQKKLINENVIAIETSLMAAIVSVGTPVLSGQKVGCAQNQYLGGLKDLLYCMKNKIDDLIIVDENLTKYLVDMGKVDSDSF